MTRTPVRAVCSQTIVQLFIPSCSGLAVPFLPRGEMTFPLEFDDRVKEKNPPSEYFITTLFMEVAIFFVVGFT